MTALQEYVSLEEDTSALNFKKLGNILGFVVHL